MKLKNDLFDETPTPGCFLVILSALSSGFIGLAASGWIIIFLMREYPAIDSFKPLFFLSELAFGIICTIIGGIVGYRLIPLVSKKDNDS